MPPKPIMHVSPGRDVNVKLMLDVDPKLLEPSRLLIGIDCGTDTGVAVWDPKRGKLTSLKTMKIHRAMEAVRLMHAMPGVDVMVYFEDARQRTWFEREKSQSEYRGKLMGAGAVKRDSAIWEDFLTDMHIPFQMVAPRNNATKIKGEYFNRITGWDGPSSEHSRDAAMLVFNRK